MITEKDTIKCEVIFNDQKTHRFLWERVWNKDKPVACVVMINPCMADTIVSDTTTELVVKNIARLGEYGGVSIVNLYSLLTNKLVFRNAEQLNDADNDQYIKKAAEEAAIVVLAWGKSADTNLAIADRAEHVIKLLKGQKEKLRLISDGKRMGIHPLTPSARAHWELVNAEKWLETSAETARKCKEKEKAKEKVVKSEKLDTTIPQSVDY